MPALLELVKVVPTRSTLPSSLEVINVNEVNQEFIQSESEVGMLWQYVQSLSPDTIAHLSRPTSPEVMQVMERNIIGLLGGLPGEGFDVAITTNRDSLGRLLASAMMSGYFLRNAEQRLAFDKSLTAEVSTDGGR
jgi:Protein of unknown function (DUF760)